VSAASVTCDTCGEWIGIPPSAISWRMAMETKSLANVHAHWRVRDTATKAHHGHVALTFPTKLKGAGEYEGNWTVRMVRIAPRELDNDNLRNALKATRDAVTKQLGFRDDRDPRLRWLYGQERGKPKEHAVVVQIWKEEP
jgi:hypothetical protein